MGVDPVSTIVVLGTVAAVAAYTAYVQAENERRNTERRNRERRRMEKERRRREKASRRQIEEDYSDEETSEDEERYQPYLRKSRENQLHSSRWTKPMNDTTYEYNIRPRSFPNMHRPYYYDSERFRNLDYWSPEYSSLETPDRFDSYSTPPPLKEEGSNERSCNCHNCGEPSFGLIDPIFGNKKQSITVRVTPPSSTVPGSNSQPQQLEKNEKKNAEKPTKIDASNRGGSSSRPPGSSNNTNPSSGKRATTQNSKSNATAAPGSSNNANPSSGKRATTQNSKSNATAASGSGNNANSSSGKRATTQNSKSNSTAASGSGSQQPQRNGDENNKKDDEQSDADYGCLNDFIKLLKTILERCECSRELRVKFLDLFNNFYKHTDNFMRLWGDLIEQGLTEDVLTIVVRLFKSDAFAKDLTYPNFISLIEFVAQFIKDEAKFQIAAEDAEDDFKLPYEVQYNINIKKQFTRDDILEAITKEFNKIREAIIEDNTAHPLDLDFSDIFTKVYHYFKHREVRGNVMPVAEYLGWIRKLLAMVKGLEPEYTELVDPTHRRREIIFEMYVTVFKGRIRIVLRVYGTKVKICTVFVREKEDKHAKDGDIYVDGKQKK